VLFDENVSCGQDDQHELAHHQLRQVMQPCEIDSDDAPLDDREEEGEDAQGKRQGNPQTQHPKMPVSPVEFGKMTATLQAPPPAIRP
jgi:hypothetical protein